MYNVYMSEQLFGSKTRAKLLELFVTNPGRAFFVREITRRVDEQINSVRRELANLQDVGIVTSENKDNKLFYKANEKSRYFSGLARLFDETIEDDVIAGESESGFVSASASSTESNSQISGSKQSLGSRPGPKLVTKRRSSEYDSLGKVVVVLQSGKFTRDLSSGIDMLIVGDISKVKLKKFISDLEVEESMEINYTSMPQEEFEYRQKVNDRFVTNLLLSRYIVRHDPFGLIGN
jgi:DNA-binding transcriptional ArsR family regulator